MGNEKDYSTISPSARSLLLLKGSTNIPYAKEAATLIISPEPFGPPAGNGDDFGFWARVLHFENRYWSINQLLDETDTKNMLELSSGYSFRGLDIVNRRPVHYIDTDLDEVVSQKRHLISLLQKDLPQPEGLLEILPLNALHEKQFRETVDRFPAGPLTIVNEGLLMYLETDEKKKLCAIIHDTLKERGGCWITADIYIKKEITGIQIKRSAAERDFIDQHRIEENKFESFEGAELFFREAGFEKLKEAKADHSRLSALPHLIGAASPEQAKKLENVGRIQATWMLKPY
jgi:O-methyltransferase involved in polyketide biosynthesis